MRPPTAEEIKLAATINDHGDPIQLAADTKPNRPPAPGKRPRGRPRKDGQPPRQSPEAAAKEHHAAAAIVNVATNANAIRRTAKGAERNEFVPDTIHERIKHLELTYTNARACAFLRLFAESGYRSASKSMSATPCEVQGWKHNEDFRRIYNEIQNARDAATAAKTCGTLELLANGEYRPKPDCLPPDMRAASLLMPAIDPRFRANSQTAAQAVQINISI